MEEIRSYSSYYSMIQTIQQIDKETSEEKGGEVVVIVVVVVVVVVVCRVRVLGSPISWSQSRGALLNWGTVRGRYWYLNQNDVCDCIHAYDATGDEL